MFETLSKQKQTKIEEKAEENLIEQGINPSFILPSMIRFERNKLLEKKKGKVIKN